MNQPGSWPHKWAGYCFLLFFIEYKVNMRSFMSMMKKRPEWDGEVAVHLKKVVEKG
jgi:hypothetical protein